MPDTPWIIGWAHVFYPFTHLQWPHEAIHEHTPILREERHLSQAHFTAVLKQIETSQFATEQVQASTAKLRHAWEPHQQALFKLEPGVDRDLSGCMGNASSVE